MIKWLLAAAGLLALLLALVPAPIDATAPDGSPTPTKNASATATRTRAPTNTPTPFPEPRPAPDWMQVGVGGRNYGSSLSTAGDVNGDGYADAVIAQTLYLGPGGTTAAYLYYGSASSLISAPAWTYTINTGGAGMGLTVSAAGDVNGDGYDDVIIGAPDFIVNIEGQGRVYLFYGSPAGLAAKPAWTATGDKWHAYLGSTVDGAGDINSDGYDDIIAGASGYNGGLGWAQGRAYAWCGSPAGLGATPCWTATSDQAGSRFGAGATAGAGDVNGDGFTDVLVAAPQYDGDQPSEGRVYLYFGSANGLGAAPGWDVKGGQAGATLGDCQAAAGDLDRDGYSDILLGAPGFDAGQADEGRAFLYLGAAGGPGGTAAWTASGNQANARFGSVAVAVGDTNGDGYGDIAVGAPLYDNGETDEGAVFVYHGSPIGLNSAPAEVIEAEKARTNFGGAGAAGDVNRDGLADLLVGAPEYDANQLNAGAAFVYAGVPAVPQSTDTPTPSATPSQTRTPTDTPRPSESPTLTPTGTPEPTGTPTPRPAVSPTDTPAMDATPSRLYLPLVAADAALPLEIQESGR